ncbi:MAG: aspartate kinase [Kangiellaceae bacterium]|nr:aspartate kinase [Kangiellaceae bacterium]
MKVLKFGGTSIGNPERMRKVADIAHQQGQVLVVLSAVSGTTDALYSIFTSIRERNIEQAEATTRVLMDTYKDYIGLLLETEEYQKQAASFVQTQLQDVLDNVRQRFVSSLEFHLLAKGEIISTELFHLLLQEQQRNSRLLLALDFLKLDQDSRPDEPFLEIKLNSILSESKDTQIVVTQGFICRSAFGEVSNLKRGGSDYSASLFAAAIKSEELQIWTDIDGMHNNDPRFVENTYPIRELSFDEAAELAYFGAKILHPASIKPARRNSIPVRLLNTLSPNSLGTKISYPTERAKVKAVAAKSGITAIKIRSSEMLQAQGFLRRIFEVFELYHTSIDMVTTSEVAVSVTIDDDKYLDRIVQTLSEFGNVEVDIDLSIVSVVGEYLIENHSITTQVISSLKDVAIRMISFGGSPHNISLLVSEKSKVEALNALQRGLFNV